MDTQWCGGLRARVEAVGRRWRRFRRGRRVTGHTLKSEARRKEGVDSAVTTLVITLLLDVRLCWLFPIQLANKGRRSLVHAGGAQPKAWKEPLLL